MLGGDTPGASEPRGIRGAVRIGFAIDWIMRDPGTDERFRSTTKCDGLSENPPQACAYGVTIHSSYGTSLVRDGKPFYNPSNTASEAVVTLSSPSRADNRNAQNGWLSASECLKIFHFEISQEH